MLKISRTQLINRRDSLPMNLREALSSERNADILWQICEAQHISKEKIYTVATLAGDVLLGFIHYDDLANGIRQDLGVAPEIARTIAEEIDRKIFNPIRASLEKVYAPVSEEIADLRAKAEEKKPEEKTVAEIFETGPVEGTESFKITDIKPAEASAVREPAVEIPGVIPLAEAEAGPMIIHKETEFKPVSGPKKSLGGLFGFLRGRQEKPESAAVKARVEVGGAPKAEEIKKPVKTIEPKIRVVHYTDVPDVKSPFPEQQTSENPLMVLEGEEKEKNKIEAIPPENLPIIPEIEPPKEILPPAIEPKPEFKPKIMDVIKTAKSEPAANDEMIDLNLFK